MRRSWGRGAALLSQPYEVLCAALTFAPWSEPGWCLSTVFRLIHNGWKNTPDSPAETLVALISVLSHFGDRPNIHPTTPTRSPAPRNEQALDLQWRHPEVSHQLSFSYYDDGNLLSIPEEGGSNADGSPPAGRSWVFTHTTADGSGPAIPQRE